MTMVLRILEGPEAGRAIKLERDEVLIGSSDRAALRVRSADVSREHAVVRVEGAGATVQNLSARGTKVEGRPVEGRARLRPRERLELAPHVVLQLEESIPGSTRRLRLLLLLASAVVLAVALAVFSRQAHDAQAGPADDWNRAYALTTQWLDTQARLGNLPGEVSEQFLDAYRYERGDFPALASEAWGRLNLRLSGLPIHPRSNPTTFQEAAARHPEALDMMLTGRNAEAIPDEQHAASTLQFIRRSYSYNHRKAVP